MSALAIFTVARIALTVWIITHNFLLVKYLFALSAIFFPRPANAFILRTAISAVSYTSPFTEACSFLYLYLRHFILYAAYDVPEPEVIVATYGPATLSPTLAIGMPSA